MKGLTPARRRALEVVARHGDFGRESNVTDLDRGLVYWQSADWLVSEGVCSWYGSTRMLGLTAYGREVARAEGLL
jgi:hypothetical protein